MVRLGAKLASGRRAVVRGQVELATACVARLTDAAATEIARTARIAGIQGAKQTASLIPLCHPIPLTGVDLEVRLDRETGCFTVAATAETQAPTGVEMEAFTAVAVAALTVYDMVKAVDPAATIGALRLVEKHGGKDGAWARNNHRDDRPGSSRPGPSP